MIGIPSPLMGIARGGILEVSFQIDFLHKISRFYTLVGQSQESWRPQGKSNALGYFLTEGLLAKEFFGVGGVNPESVIPQPKSAETQLSVKIGYFSLQNT
jgi:hypothetical protein